MIVASSLDSPAVWFPDHTVDTAPPGARRAMEATTKRLGYLPSPVARLASSPELLDGFLRLTGMFESTTLDPVAREVLIMTVATRNGCHVCVAMHTARLIALGADPDLIATLRAGPSVASPAADPAAIDGRASAHGRALTDDRLAAIRAFTIAVLDSAGAVSDDALRSFLAHGYTHQNALEVVLGIGTYTLSTFANRLTRAPLDPPLHPHAWPA